MSNAERKSVLDDLILSAQISRFGLAPVARNRRMCAESARVRCNAPLKVRLFFDGHDIIQTTIPNTSPTSDSSRGYIFFGIVHQAKFAARHIHSLLNAKKKFPGRFHSTELAGSKHPIKLGG
jgi:hypothetical protein